MGNSFEKHFKQLCTNGSNQQITTFIPVIQNFSYTYFSCSLTVILRRGSFQEPESYKNFLSSHAGVTVKNGSQFSLLVQRAIDSALGVTAQSGIFTQPNPSLLLAQNSPFITALSQSLAKLHLDIKSVQLKDYIPNLPPFVPYLASFTVREAAQNNGSMLSILQTVSFFDLYLDALTGRNGWKVQTYGRTGEFISFVTWKSARDSFFGDYRLLVGSPLGKSSTFKLIQKRGPWTLIDDAIQKCRTGQILFPCGQHHIPIPPNAPLVNVFRAPPRGSTVVTVHHSGPPPYQGPHQGPPGPPYQGPPHQGPHQGPPHHHQGPPPHHQSPPPYQGPQNPSPQNSTSPLPSYNSSSPTIDTPNTQSANNNTPKYQQVRDDTKV